MANKEIPGFYRDPKTGKYYRERPHDNNESLKKLKLERENEQPIRSRGPLQGLSVPHFLRRREFGTFSGTEVVQDYYKSRTTSKTLLDTVDLRTAYNGISGVEYVKAGSRSVFGLWHSTNLMFPYALGEASQMSSEPALYKNFQKCYRFVQDLCEIFTDTIVYVQNDFADSGTINLVWQDDNSPSGYMTYSHFHTNREPLYCCSAAFLGFIRLAVGGVNSICYYNELSPLREYKVEGRTMTISFDDSKDFIISGHSNGLVYMHDLRAEPPAFVSQIETGRNSCLVDSYFLSPNKIIITGVSNKLITFDIRSMKPVTEFFGHKHSVKKHALSVGNDMLCVNGADNVIRIWHISGGLPVHEIRPSNPRNQIRGCIRTEFYKTYLYYFEGSTRKVFQL